MTPCQVWCIGTPIRGLLFELGSTAVTQVLQELLVNLPLRVQIKRCKCGCKNSTQSFGGRRHQVEATKVVMKDFEGLP